MRLIDADALIDKIDDRYSLHEIGRRERDDIVDALEYAPTIQPIQPIQPRREDGKIGEWIYDWGDWDFETCKCSECGNHSCTEIGKRYNFCPYCGADMRGEHDE